MDLRSWLDARGYGATAALARAVETRWATIYEIANGHIPKADLAKKIEAATGGEVTAAELLGITVATIPRPASAAHPPSVEPAAE